MLLGTEDIKKIYLGETEISKLALGDLIVYEQVENPEEEEVIS